MLMLWKTMVLRLLYPPRCPGCGSAVKEHGLWCRPCFSAVWRPRLLSGSRTRSLEGCYCLCDYRRGIRKVLHRIKYGGALQYENACRHLLEQFPWTERLSHIDGVVPVPLSPEKERQRGFNQVHVIFREWSDTVGVWEDALQRVRSTKSQWLLERGERAANVNRAFEVKGSVCMRDKHLLLVDDIFTTGATMNACAQALKRKGAASVTGLVIASGAP